MKISFSEYKMNVYIHFLSHICSVMNRNMLGFIVRFFLYLSFRRTPSIYSHIYYFKFYLLVKISMKKISLTIFFF